MLMMHYGQSIIYMHTKNVFKSHMILCNCLRGIFIIHV